MGDVVRIARHRRHRCTHDPAEAHRCMSCAGGIYLCDVCGGAEGSLPTDCPGRRMDHDEERQVYAGLLDFRVDCGGWTLQPSAHSPRRMP